jgi:hypothetical protein
MMRSRHAVLALAMIALACTEREQLLAPEPSQKDAPQASLVRGEEPPPPDDDRYPTEEEFESYGGASSVSITRPVGRFTSSSFGATATATFTWVNVAKAYLDVSILDDAGRSLNTSKDSYSLGVYRPVPRIVKDLAASVSTLNRQCGIVGKSAAGAMGELWLTRQQIGSVQPIRLFDKSDDVSGFDAALPPCEKEEGTIIWESGEGCGDAEYCKPGSGGSEGGSGSGEPTGGGPFCTLWQFTVYESQDGGWSWYEVDRYFRLIC